MDVHETAKKAYEDFERQEAELKKEFDAKVANIKKEKAALKKYLVSVGIIEVKKRGRRKKTTEPKA